MPWGDSFCGVIVSYVETKKGEEDAFFGERSAWARKVRRWTKVRPGTKVRLGTNLLLGTKGRQSPFAPGTAAWLVVELLGCWLGDLAGTEPQRLVAAGAVRGRRLGDRVSGADPAGGGGVPEGGDLGRFDALGKAGGLRLGGVRTLGAGGRLGPGGAGGGVG